MAIATAFSDHVGGPVAWRSSGAYDTPAAVFLHGLGGNRASWGPQLSDLSDIRFCCAWELPGYGDSPGVAGSLPEIADVAAAWIAGLGGGPVDVVGLSFGGMVAQHLALAHPNLVRTLALLDTSPAFGMDGTTTPESWLASRVGPMRAGAVTDERAEEVVAALVGPRCPDDVRAAAAASMRALPRASLDASCRALVDHDTRGRLHEIEVPTLVVVGAEDTETPPSYAEAIAERITGAELVVVPDSGHLANVEAPQVVNDLLRNLWARGTEGQA